MSRNSNGSVRPNRPTRRRNHTPAALALALATFSPFATRSAHATSDTWDGSTDGAWATTSNWLTDPAAVPGAGETATFSLDAATVNNNTTIDLGAGVTIGAILFDTSAAAAYTLGSGAVGSQTLTLGTTGNAITLNSTVANNQLINASLGLTVTRTASNPSTYYAVTNNSATNTLTVAGGISASTAGVKVLHVTGAGNGAISGSISSGTGNVSLFKTGTGTLTLSGGATFSGNGVTDGANFASSAVFREGTTILNGGSYSNSGGELVVGGVATHGGAGTNTTLQLDNGAILNNIVWLSIGRGNGTGTTTSNLVLNGSSSVATTNLSAGYNANSVLNTPKGTITLNDTSSLSSGGEFHLGESGGANFTMTLNDSSSVTLTGDSGNPARRYIGGSNGGTGGGTGILTLNDSATFTDQGAANSFNVGYQNGNGTVNINAGTTFTTGAEIRVAASNTNGTFSGSGTINVSGGTLNMKALTLARNNNDVASTFAATLYLTSGTVNVINGSTLIGWRGTSSSGAIHISGGTFNQGTTATANMVIGSFLGATGSVNVSGTGALAFQNNSNLRFSDVANANAARTLTIDGGSVTFYSDAGTTVGGTGIIDLMLTSNPTGTSTINLNGGTLTANQLKATSATGTRVVNFNGGTLKIASAGQAAAFFATGTASAANVRNGGAVINTNSLDATISQVLAHSNIGGDNAADGGLTKAGAGVLTLTGANSFTGATTVAAGTLATGATGTFGAGNVVVAADAVLALGNSSSVADEASLTFTDTSSIVLNDTSGSEGLASLLDSTSSLALAAAGTYTASELNSYFGNSVFTSSSGQTITIVPEPSSLVVFGLASITSLTRRRRWR
jgi:autotransporter-associated beta strand protein